ncbi:MAG: Class A beta-lactamase [uncultured Sphingomonas sp.]|uniref:beta-lactamase n=1 Tax=uncultured Sphingomonas sp. TaxID=158754 RepID=A0A6J4SRW8_9SPHN|nr:serine hydrolase [uncultured Sphingomonas sp.]CAA9503615.1 MAG: Class A beta-lactamase [uncultured Sphingomonas sp.]
MTALLVRLGAAATAIVAPGLAAAQTVPPWPPAAVRPAAPAALAARIHALGSSFNGRVGIAVQAVEGGWRAGWRADELYPQQSVSKFFVALAAMDAVDRGRIRLHDPVTLTRSDLTLFNQPIAQRVLGNGSYTTTVERLLVEAITKSDNTANDKLMRVVGGPGVVRLMIAEKRLGQIRFYEGERALQSRIAGLTWTQSYSVGDAFYKARNALPLTLRRSLFERYIEDPYDGAAPSSIVDTLARLKRAELLSPPSTARLLTIMGNTRTGKNRLRGGLKPGWTLCHKTGTGQVLGAVQAGYNDIGIITAPDGRSYAVAVMIKRTATPLIVRMNLMNNVVRAVIDQHETVYAANLRF